MMLFMSRRLGVEEVLSLEQFSERILNVNSIELGFGKASKVIGKFCIWSCFLNGF